MRRLMFLLAAFLLSPSVLSAVDGSRLPKDLPPVLGVATAVNSKETPSAVVIRIVVPAMTAEVRGEVVPKRSWPKADVQVTPREVTIVIDPKSPSQLVGSEVFTTDGEVVVKADLLRKLSKPKPVLISTTGRAVDPFYLRVVKPDTLVVVLGARDGSPNLSLVPQVSVKDSL